MIKKQQIKSKKDNLLLIGEMAIARTIQTIDRLKEQLCNQNKKTLLFIFLFMYIIPSIIKNFIHIISFSLINNLNIHNVHKCTERERTLGCLL